MKINKIKINAFGNLQNKEIEFSNGINIIHGKNESGKSTLLKFIVDMFYGISKNKRGKDFSDYDRYKPWNSEEFSGKLGYTLDNEKKYEIFRDFNKKNPKIYNSLAEDISKDFNIDKTNGSEFFIEQTGIDENMFLASHVSAQREVVLNTSDQNILIQKIANYANSGDDSISYKKMQEKLNKKQVEEIGTTRTSGRPLNILKEEKYKLQDELGELEEYKEKKYDIEDEKNKIEQEIKNSENKLNYLRKIKSIFDEEKIEQEKNNLNEKIKNENDDKINELILEKNKIINEINSVKNTEKNTKKSNKSNIWGILSELITIVLLIINLVVLKIDILTYILIALIPVILIIFVFLNNKEKNKNKKENLKEINELKEKINIINSQVELLEKNSQDKKIEIEKNRERINVEFNAKKDKLFSEYKNSINNIEEINVNKENINYYIENINDRINKEKLNLHALELDKTNIIPKLERMASIEEKLQNINEQEEELLKNNEAIELIKEVLEIAYKKMKENVTPEFTKNLSQNIEKISNGKYKNIRINDEEGIIVEKENGEYIPAEKLSVGTIDQLYLSLRFAALNEISKESMPIILDESFAYCDSERLENIFGFLNEQSNNNQIIIFTCTNREIETLNKLGIEFNSIQL